MSFRRVTGGLRGKLVLAVILPLLLSVCSGLAVFFALRVARSAQREVLETDRRVETSELLLRLILEAETGQRGFALTGQASYLEPFNEAGREWPDLVERLRNGFAGEPEQLSRLARIDSLFSTWLTQIALPVVSGRRELPPSHLDAIHEARSALFGLLETRGERAGQKGSAIDDARREGHERLRQAVDSARLSLGQSRLAELWNDVDARLRAVEAARTARAAPAVADAALDSLLRQTNLAAEASFAAERRALAPITSGAGKELVDWIRKLQADLAAHERRRLEATLARNTLEGRIASWVAISSLALALALGLTTALLLANRLRLSLREVGRVAEKLAAGDLRQRALEVEGDDIGRLARSFNRLADRVAARDREVALLHDLGQLLQSANDEEEAFRVVARLVPALVPGASGAIFALSHKGDDLVRRSTFGVNERAGPEHCAPGSCWALRKGQTYLVLDPGTQVLCDHLAAPAWPYICVPLAAQGHTIGLLYLETAPEQGDARLSAALGLLPTVASEVALALGNLALRAELRAQSVRDPLTGLFNRRYLEETLAREIDRAKRKQLPLAVAMTDLDHFKRLNDTWGHEAGDQVLKFFAELLRSHFRTQDVLCRYGGEEFALVFPDCTTSQAEARAEDLLAALRDSEVPYGASTIREITASIGIAGFPLQGATPDALLRGADRALYEAKRAGRDQVQLAADALPSTFGEDTGYS
jgi:diguanylate cyclase (GGDEF)-like protein